MNYASYYECFVFENLAQLFQLTEDKVKSIVSGMIYQESLAASIDFSTNTVILNKSVHGSTVDLLAAQYADKLSIFVESNIFLKGMVNPGK
jgi:hypothetical protein